MDSDLAGGLLAGANICIICQNSNMVLNFDIFCYIAVY
jgi:hypothetical protein